MLEGRTRNLSETGFRSIAYGQRSTTARKKLGSWLRGLGINDPAVSPAHSWRHWFIEACRAVQMHPEVRSALTGHSAKMDESAAYGSAMGSFIEVLGQAMASVRSPVP